MSTIITGPGRPVTITLALMFKNAACANVSVAHSFKFQPKAQLSLSVYSPKLPKNTKRNVPSMRDTS